MDHPIKKLLLQPKLWNKIKTAYTFYIMGRLCRYLILHYIESHLRNGEQSWWSPSKSSCLFFFLYLESNQVNVLWKKILIFLLSSLEFYQHLPTFSVIFSSYRFQVKKKSQPFRCVVSENACVRLHQIKQAIPGSNSVQKWI